MAQRKQEEMISPELLASLVPEDAVEQKTSFPPYWVPEIGAHFKATLIGKEGKSEEDIDERDDNDNREGNSNFTRYEFLALEQIACKQGPARKQEDVIVPAGERFTTSAYGSLNLDLYLGFDVTVVVVGNRKLPANKQSRGVERDLWLFKVYTDKKTDGLLKDLRLAEATAQREFIRTNRIKQIAAVANTKGLNNGATVEGEKVDRIPF
jgi:hypothetical protein